LNLGKRAVEPNVDDATAHGDDLAAIRSRVTVFG
jgi:hypothetical protein